MKVFNNSVGKTLPDFKNASVFLVKPLDEKKRSIDGGMLEKAVSKQMKKKKKKVNRINSDRNLYLTGREQWCSLDKLVSINKAKNDDITRHIKEKAELESRNEQLKLMMLNPTLRQHDLNQKIYNLEHEVVQLKRQLEDKEMLHREEIQNLRQKHSKQIDQLRQNYSKSSAGQYQTSTHQKTYQSYQPYQVPRSQSPPKIIQTSQAQPTTVASARTYAHQPHSFQYKESQKEPQESIYTSTYRSANHYTSANNNNANQGSRTAVKYDVLPSTRDTNREKEGNSSSYVNVFGNTNTSQNNRIVQANRNVQVTRYEANPSNRVQVEAQVKRSYSPNSTKNSNAGHSNVVRYEPKVNEIHRSPSPPKPQQQQEYRTTVTKPVIKQGQNSARPVSFAGQGGIGVNQIDDIYKRYCLND